MTENLPPGPEREYNLEDKPNATTHLMQLFSAHGDIFKVFSKHRNQYTYVLSDPEMAKQVLVTNSRNYAKGVGIERVKILLGNGIMVSEGDYWRRQRRMIQPAFHRKIIAQLGTDIVEMNKRMLDAWLAHPAEINLTDELSKVTLYIVLKALFSVDFERMEKQGKHPFSLLTSVHERDLLFAVKFRALSKVIADLIQQRRNEKRVEEDFLSLIMEAKEPETGKGMSNKEIIDEMMTLLVAGHETTASALTWAWYLLHKHPETYAKVKREVRALKDVVLGFEHLENLGFVKQVVEETMRLYPPGWLLTRRAIQEDRIGGFYVPAHTDIFIAPYVIHRHPRYWDKPELFSPARFDASLHKERPRFSYFPFSGGPRQCIGDFFALVEMQLHLAVVLREVDLEIVADEPIGVEAQINLRPNKPIFAKVIAKQ